MNYMKNSTQQVSRLLIYIVFCALFSSTLQVSSATLDVTNPSILEAYFDGVIKPTMKKVNSPSGVVAVMKDDKVIFAKGYGFSDVAKKIPVDPQKTLFRPGSISKLFTWVSVMQLVERGKLDLDVDVNRYLQTFKVEDTWPGQAVTLRHIMTHTAGFEDGAMGYLILKDASRIVPLADSLASHQPRRVNPPGAHVAYSNWATALAGLIVANVSGQNFNAYVQTHIFDVLEMQNSTFVEPLPENLDELRAKEYTFANGKFEETGYEFVSNFGPAGSAATTAYDMTKFAQALLNNGKFHGKQLLAKETLAQMLSEGFSHDARVRGMGLGFIKYRYGADNLAVFGHDGATTSFLSHFGLSQSENLMLFTSFSGDPLPADVHKATVQGFYDEFFPNNSPKSAIETSNLERYAGTYSSWRNNFTQAEALLRLTGEITVTALVDTLLINNKRYQMVANNLFEEVDGYGRIAFQEDLDGNIEGFVNDGFGVQQFYRAAFYETANFNLWMISIVLLTFCGVLSRLAYQWSSFRQTQGCARYAALTAIGCAIFNLLFFIILFLILSDGADKLVFEISLTLKLALVCVLMAVTANVLQLFMTVSVWKYKACKNTFARIRYTFVSACALFMCWFYSYWNLIGFNYFT